MESSRQRVFAQRPISGVEQTINMLQRELEKVKLGSKEENERIRQYYYEVVAYGHSRATMMVRSAMCSAPSAEKIMKELERMFKSSVMNCLLTIYSLRYKTFCDKK